LVTKEPVWRWICTSTWVMQKRFPHKTLTGTVLAALLLLLLGIAVTPSWAARIALPDRYISLSPGKIFADKNRQTNDGWQIGGAAGVTLNANWAVEGEAFFGRLGQSGYRYDQFGGGVGLMRYLHHTPKFSAFARGGIGGLWTDQPSSGGPKFYGELGVGFFQPLPGTPLHLRLDMAHRQTHEASVLGTDTPWSDWRLSVGLAWLFERPPVVLSRAAPIPAPPPPGDADGDWVTDPRDRCPDTPSGVVVNPSGCPADFDRDGVTDQNDRCPDTPMDTPVDRFGCELDDDADGVINRLDQCPDTPAGVKVDAVGCPVVKVIRLKGVNFHHNSARLTQSAHKVLDDTAASLKEHRGVLIEVAGHTDSRGMDAYNLSLSSRRAVAVRNYLVIRGVPVAMLRAKGYGETHPLTKGNKPTDHAKNRRVELRIMTLDAGQAGR
jgi:outer membrane protein OmpA-like peptidoglycan-associated protein